MIIIETVRNINHGGFGIIDEVICDDGEHYAKKTFSPSEQFKTDMTLIKKLKNRFIREVKTQERLPDDYFIPILFYDLDVENPFFIMPLADSVYTDEIQLCKTENRNPEGLGDILNALEFLHDKGYVHRDLKPQNILKHNGVWKLADFGLISQDREILSQTITTSKEALGTTMYCAPEQVVEFKRITPQADIYSFGAILHDIFTDGNRVPYSELTADGEIGLIIEKCTKHKKEHRFSNISSVRSNLLKLLLNKRNKSANDQDLLWQDNFSHIENWDVDLLEKFVFYVKRSESISDLLFYEINEEVLKIIHSIDKELFDEFSLTYLEWINSRYFSFDYCDVVVNNIYCVFQNSKDIEVKSKCVLSAAELGRSNNRWYVMKYVVRMSNKEIDDNLAFRIGMDIGFEQRNKNNFIKCVEQINQTINSYHRLIKEAIQ